MNAILLDQPVGADTGLLLYLRKRNDGPRVIAPRGTYVPPFELVMSPADIAAYEDADRRGCAGD